MAAIIGVSKSDTRAETTDPKAAPTKQLLRPDQDIFREEEIV